MKIATSVTVLGVYLAMLCLLGCVRREDETAKAAGLVDDSSIIVAGRTKAECDSMLVRGAPLQHPVEDSCISSKVRKYGHALKVNQMICTDFYVCASLAAFYWRYDSVFIRFAESAKEIIVKGGNDRLALSIDGNTKTHIGFDSVLSDLDLSRFEAYWFSWASEDYVFIRSRGRAPNGRAVKYYSLYTLMPNGDVRDFYTLWGGAGSVVVDNGELFMIQVQAGEYSDHGDQLMVSLIRLNGNSLDSQTVDSMVCK